MADLSEYTEFQQKTIKDILKNDKGFHNNYMIANAPFYNMLGELESGELDVRKNVSCSLSTGTTDYDLQIFYSTEQNCWFYSMTYLGDEIRGVVHYNTVFNAMGEIAFAILNDNTDDKDLTASIPYSNVLVMRK
jgi:hypothetical protein